MEWVRSVCSLVSNKHSLVFTRNISALISQKKHENEDDDVAHMDGMHVAIVNLSIKTLRQKYKKDLRPISSILVDEKKSHKLFSWVCRAPHFGKKTRTMTNGSRKLFSKKGRRLRAEAFEHILECYWDGFSWPTVTIIQIMLLIFPESILKVFRTSAQKDLSIFVTDCVVERTLRLGNDRWN